MKKIILVLMSLLIGISLIFAFSVRTNVGGTNGFKFFNSKENKLTVHSQKTIEGNFDLDNMIFNLEANEINLTGNDNNTYNLVLDYYEYSEGDVDFFFNDSNFKFKSLADKGVYIKSLTGTIPNNIKLKIDNGTGAINLKKYKGKSIVIDNGTGKITIEDTDGISLDIDNGTGNISITSGKFDKFLSIDNGTGNISIDNEIFNGDIVIDNGVGNVMLNEVVAPSASIDNGTGNIIVKNSKLLKIEADTGIGNIIFKNNNFNSKDVDTGIGSILDENNERISY